MEVHSGYYKVEELTKINKYITQKENLNFFKEEMKINQKNSNNFIKTCIG